MNPRFYAGMRRMWRQGLHPFFRVRIEGDEHVPRSGPVIIASNHIHRMDPWPIVVAVPRRVHFVVAADHLRKRGWSSVVRRCGVIPVRRDGTDLPGLMAALRVLRSGETIGIYPEGDLSEGYALHRARAGVAYLAALSGAPVVPCATWGIEALDHPRRFFQGRRPRVVVRFGPPLRLALPPRSERSQRFEEETDRIMCAIAALLPERYRGAYRGPRGATPAPGAPR